VLFQKVSNSFQILPPFFSGANQLIFLFYLAVAFVLGGGKTTLTSGSSASGNMDRVIWFYSNVELGQVGVG
jgi:hypothetical protein